MLKILFVCHGNICRSPMAEFVLRKMVNKAGLGEEFYIESAATSSEEIGNHVYPPVMRLLREHGIDCSRKTARRITKHDYDNFDLLIGMDDRNIKNMRLFYGGDPEGKLKLLMDYTDNPHPVADPWYTGDFEATWCDVNAGCSALLSAILK